MNSKMWCDWFDRGGCSEPPYGVIGFTDINYIIYCDAHVVEAVEEACDYIGTHPGVGFDDEEDTRAAIKRLIEENMNDRPDLWRDLAY